MNKHHHQPSVGHLIRDWRQLRRLSQLDLSLEAEISQKHLSFIESGRSVPSRDMVVHLAEHLGVPLRERNALLLAAGYAPLYLERSLDDPELTAARAAIDLVLKGHEPYPAVAIDRHWTLLAANAAIAPIAGLASEASLLAGPVNVLRLSLHPGGLAPHIANFSEWRAHLLSQLRQQIRATADQTLAGLLEELMSYPGPQPAGGKPEPEIEPWVIVPLRLRIGDQLLSLISTRMAFCTPVEITLSELTLETFFPADPATAAALRALTPT
jgi:transcriptional regulator with XRE-family HTH domain